MPMVNQQIVDNIVKQLKSQGIFDQFRRDCLADVDTKPSYQNLRQRVEGYVSKFLSQQTWNASLNKNQLRDELRRQINESGMLSIGVEHVVDQIVNSKANRVFLPQIEIAARRYLGLDRDQNYNEDNEQLVKDEKDTDRMTTFDIKETTQNGVKDPVNSQIKEVPSLIFIQDKAQDNVTHIAEEDKEEAVDPPEVVSAKLPQKDIDSYVILNTSRETETTISGDDELLPPGVDFASPAKKLVEVEELAKGEDTSSSFNSEPLVIYDPQASSNDNSSELPSSNKGSPNEEKTEPTMHHSTSNFNKRAISSEASFDDLLKTKPSSQLATEAESKTGDERDGNVPGTLESKHTGDTDEKKSLESEIKKLLELGDKEKMEQAIRRILEIESKKMVEKELKKREVFEASKVQNEDGKSSSMENSRSNSLTDLTKEKPKTEKSRETSTKSENLSRSNSSSEISRDKYLSKSDKTKLSDFSNKSSSKHDYTKSKGHKSHDANKKSDSKNSKSSPSKGKLDHKSESSESKSNYDKLKSKPKSSTFKSSSKFPDSKTPKSTEISKNKSASSSGATKLDSSSKINKPALQAVKEKSRFVPIKANIVKPVSKHSLTTGKDASSKSSQEKDKKHEKDGSKKDSTSKPKSLERKDSQSHIFKSPDNRSPEKKVEIESSETDDDFIKTLNNLKKGENKKDDEDKKSDVSVSSVHTSDLSSFDDEISLSSDEELKTVPLPTPVKEIKKMPLKDIKEITATIKDKQTSGRSTPIPAEELEKKLDSYHSVDESSSQREDLTSETQTDDDDKGRRSGLRRQRKLNPKYASDEYSSIFNKTRRERKSTEDSKQNKSNTEPSDSRKRRYSRTQERQSSKGDSESESSIKSSRIETATNKGARDLTVITLDDDSNSLTELPTSISKPKEEFYRKTKLKLGKNKK